ncbi:MAG: MFS transporter [Clostridiales bacterium]|jgi:MFS family permease|nr:MFS transporter [Eubacteriales bacterium]MDH7567876.1 MFS transporter [Clostridiales bacterium]
MVKKNMFMIKFAILAMTFNAFCGGSLTPALADIMKAFPQVPPSVVMMLVTLPSLIMVPFTLLTGVIAGRYVKYRTCLLLGFGLFAITGAAPVFLNDFNVIMVMRALNGAATGLIGPLYMALIFRLIPVEERAGLMGLTGVFMSLSAMVFSMIGGFLAVMDWHLTFLTNLFSVFMLIIVFFFVPEPEDVPAGPATAGGPMGGPAAAPQKPKMPAMVWVICILFGIYNLLFMPTTLNISPIIVTGGMGNAAIAGTVITVNTLGGMVAGLIFGKVFQKLTRFTLPLGFGIGCVGLILFLAANSLPLIFVAMAVMGFGFALGGPAINMAIGAIAPPQLIALATSALNVCMGIGGFASSLFAAGLAGALGVTGMAALKLPFIVFLIGVAGFTVIYVLYNLMKKPAPAVPGGPAGMAQ